MSAIALISLTLSYLGCSRFSMENMMVLVDQTVLVRMLRNSTRCQVAHSESLRKPASLQRLASKAIENLQSFKIDNFNS
jgi:hypothetical protein